MSSFTDPTAQATAGTSRSSASYVEPRTGSPGAGWIVFSGVMLILAGFLNLVDGLWALDLSDSAAISDEVEEMLWYSDSLETWGWIYTIIGAVLIPVGIGVFSRRQWARWTGVAAASASMLFNMMWVFVYPTSALIHVALAATVVFALTAYGDPDSPTEASG